VAIRAVLIRPAVLIWVGAAALAAQNPLITVQVSALDGHGQPVTDLHTADFRVADDGKPQAPAFARLLTSSALRAPLAPNQFSNRTDNSIAHSTVILFDLLNADLNERGRGWTEIVQSLQRLESSDHFYLYLLTKDGSLYPVHGLPAAEDQVSSAEAPWTKEVEPLLNHAMSAVNRLETQELRVDVSARVAATFHGLELLTAQMAPLPGRKSLVWVSQGVPVFYVGLDEQRRDNTPLIRKFSEDLNRRNIPVYTVDQTPGGGLVLGGRDTLDEVSSLTGGRLFASDSTGMAITQAVTDARATYLIGFFPAAKNRDGKSHKLHVTSVRKGVKILVREDYSADPNVLPARENFENASLAPFDNPDIGLKVTVSASPDAPQSTRFQIDIDPADLLLEPAGSPSAQIELAFVDDAGSGRSNATVTTPLTIVPAKDGIVVIKDRVLPSTVRKVRIVVVDSRTGEVGTLTVPAAVPSR
jgi:VWFA-related protein